MIISSKVHWFGAWLALCSICIAAEYPDRPVKIIVPFSAGGGSDTFVRIMQRAIREHELLPQPLVIINVPGAGGTIGSRQVKKAHPDGYTLLNLHEGILSARYSGKVSYGPEAFAPIAGTGETGLILGVAEDAPFKSLREMLEQAAAKPDTILLAANLGAPSHFAARRLEQAVPGARFRYVQSGGGAKRFASLSGGHVQASVFSVAEYTQFHPAGLRALAILSEKRLPALPDIPTATEQGIEVVTSNVQCWWAPKGTDPARIKVIADAFKAVLEIETVRADLTRIHIDPIFLSADELREEMTQREKAVAAVKTSEMIKLPNFPGILGGLALLLGFGLLVGRVRRGPPWLGEAGRPAVAISMSALTVVYVLLMHFDVLSFAPASLLFLLGSGAVLGVRTPKAWLLTAIVAVVISFGCTWLFTELFVVNLP